MKKEEINKRLQAGRKMYQPQDVGEPPTSAADSLGPLIDLQGTWVSENTGWNLIALPDPNARFRYRLLMNQYGEQLKFDFVDENIPNRGITPDCNGATDQLLTGLDYQQVITQVAAEDSPLTNLRSPDGNPIHHEPGLFLHVMNHRAFDEGEELAVARLATIPHGDSVLAMGKVRTIEGAPTIPDLNALPTRVNQSLNNPYLGPYDHFEQSPFMGNVPPIPNFPGFFASNANAILQFANPGNRVRRTTVLHFDTQFGTGGIVNIPFIVREANAVAMEATFWIMEVASETDPDQVELVMQYSQTVFLDFFRSRSEPEHLIRWPHVSINTLRKV